MKPIKKKKESKQSKNSECFENDSKNNQKLDMKIINDQKINKISDENLEKKEDLIKKSSVNLSQIMTILYYFNQLEGPERYFQQGFDDDKNNLDKILVNYLFQDVGNYFIQIEDIYYIIFIFELNSKLARGGTELIELALVIPTKYINNNLKKNIIFESENFIHLLQSRDSIFYAFHLFEKKKLNQLADIILQESKYLKEQIKSFHEKISLKVENITELDSKNHNNSNKEKTLEDLHQLILALSINENK